MKAARQTRADIAAADPLHHHTALPVEAEYFPMGQPLRISTNAPAVHAIAKSLWARFSRLSNEPPLRLSIELQPGLSPGTRNAPTLRSREHLLSMVADSQNFVHADLRGGFAFAHFTEDTLADAALWQYHFLEPLAYLLTGARAFTYMHASSVSRYGRAVILCGDSGAGKTCLAFACARAGWTFHSGDATAIVRKAVPRIVGRPFEIRFRNSALQLFGELRSFPPQLRPNEKWDIEVDTGELGLATAPEGQASHIVFLNRVIGSVPTSVKPFPPGDTKSRLEKDICFGDETIRRQQKAALHTFLSLPAWQLTYSDLNDAEATLRSLVCGP